MAHADGRLDDSCDARLERVEASDGYDLRHRVWRNPTRRPEASLLALNGIMSNSRWFAPLVQGLLAAGYAVVGADRRGSGPNREARGDAPSAGQLVDDVERILEHSAPDGPVVLVGWCWGAALAINVAAHRLKRTEHRLAGLVLVTPGLHTTTAVREALAQQQDTLRTAAADDPCVRSPISESMFTAGPALEQFILADDDRLGAMTPRMVEVSGKLATAAIARLRRLELPMLLLLAGQDEATDNAATLATFGRLGSRVDTVTLPTRHGMQFDAPNAVVEHITRFTSRVIHPSD